MIVYALSLLIEGRLKRPSLEREASFCAPMI